MSDRKYVYEAMLLISQSEATDLAGVIEHINEILKRSDAELIAMKKWDERRLAYEIDKQKRGVYLLAYFEAPGAKMTGFERDCNLSERILRVLAVRADHLTLDQMKAADAREELATEAKLRAERAAERAVNEGGSVSLGAPVREKPAEEKSEAQSEAPAEGGESSGEAEGEKKETADASSEG